MREITSILEGLPLGVHIIDQLGITIYYNKACRAIDNIPDTTEIVGKPIKHLVDEGVLSKSIGLDVLVTQEFLESIQLVNGKRVYSQGTPVFDEKRQLKMVVVTCMDMPYLREMDKKLIELKDHNEKLLKQLKQYSVNGDLNSSSKAMEIVKKMADKAAQFDNNVLITGESGVGKGVLFKYIHENSHRSGKPMATLNCAAIPESLFESELFGYEAGSFTGASRHGKKGLIDLANGGTLFLDEVGDLSLPNQAKLLRVLQDKQYMSVGGLKVKTSNVRIIAATNNKLDFMVREGTFREDLFYRLNVFPIHIPPLRERREDILTLAQVLLDKKNLTYGMSKTLSGEVYSSLMNRPWPGNTRELESFIERLVLTSETNEITLNDLYAIDSFGSQGEFKPLKDPKLELNSYSEMVDHFERETLSRLLEECGSIKATSEKYNINESTLRKKVKRLKVK